MQRNTGPDTAAASPSPQRFRQAVQVWFAKQSNSPHPGVLQVQSVFSCTQVSTQVVEMNGTFLSGPQSEATVFVPSKLDAR